MTKRQISLITASCLSILILMVFPSLSKNFNSNFEMGYKLLVGEEIPDTNIVLIHINSDDIENLGGWPLKRSFYALILENLIDLKVRKIGLEVFNPKIGLI